MNRPTVRGMGHANGRIMLLGLLLGVTACSMAGGGGGRSGGGSIGPITLSQVEEFGFGTALTVVQRLRPRWLTARTQGTLRDPSPAYAHIFLNQLYFGPLGSLDQISSTEIDRIEYINARDATTQYGTGYLGGIIRVTTRGRARAPTL